MRGSEMDSLLRKRKRVIIPKLRLTPESRRRNHEHRCENYKDEGRGPCYANYGEPAVVRRAPEVSSKQPEHDSGSDIESNSQTRNVVRPQCAHVIFFGVSEGKVDCPLHKHTEAHTIRSAPEFFKSDAIRRLRRTSKWTISRLTGQLHSFSQQDGRFHIFTAFADFAFGPVSE